MNARELRTGEDVGIQLWRLAKPGTQENSGSLVTKISYRSISQLLMADANVKVLDALLESMTSQDSSSTILKLPHHVWVPRTKAEERKVRAFLRAVNPRLVLLSNVGAPNHRMNMPKLRKLIHSELGDDVLVLWTGQEGTLNLFTHLGHEPLTETIGAPAESASHYAGTARSAA